jgi:hypothetical protein
MWLNNFVQYVEGMFFFSYLQCGISGYWQVVLSMQLATNVFLVDQVVMFVQTSFKIGYKIKCRIGNERQPYVI